MDFELVPTLILLAVTSVLAIFCGYMGQRPIDLKKGPRMVPWRFLMLLLALVTLLLVVHVLNLLGFATGQRQSSF